jgi:RNA polymerase sigma factor (TIGR02999 family)
MRGGEPDAFHALFPLVYRELRVMAHRQLVKGRPDQLLDTTGLVHEAYLKLVDQTQSTWQDRRHFFAVAATAMRQVIIDAARRRRAQKRGGHVETSVLDEARVGLDGRAEEILAIDEALGRLAELNERLVRVVELRFFGGLSVEEAAQVLDVTERTVKRDWRKARAFLYHQLSGRHGSD